MTVVEALTASVAIAAQTGDWRLTEVVLRDTIFNTFAAAAPTLNDAERRDYMERLQEWHETTLEKFQQRFAA